MLVYSPAARSSIGDTAGDHQLVRVVAESGPSQCPDPPATLQIHWHDRQPGSAKQRCMNNPGRDLCAGLLILTNGELIASLCRSCSQQHKAPVAAMWGSSKGR